MSTQQRVLRFVTEFYQQHGYSPTTREITTELGLSSTSVTAYHLKRLVAHHHLRRAERGRARTYVPIGDLHYHLFTQADASRRRHTPSAGVSGETARLALARMLQDYYGDPVILYADQGNYDDVTVRRMDGTFLIRCWIQPAA